VAKLSSHRLVRSVLLALVPGLAGLSAVSARADAPSGEPLAAIDAAYGVQQERNVMFTLRDGTRLAMNVNRPVDLETGQLAAGEFPVLLSITPYGKGTSDGRYFVEHGYITVVADHRGKGYSEGVWDFFSIQEAEDGAELVRFAAGLPNTWGHPGLEGSNGKVGMFGGSYLGINQLKTAAALDQHSDPVLKALKPLKAIAPVVAANDLYRDQVFYGGMPNEQFGPIIGATTAADSLGDPVTEGNGEDATYTASIVSDHSGVVGENILASQLEFHTGEDRAYDHEFWQSRSAQPHLAQIERNGVAAMFVSGWYDLFLRGAALNYTALQNAAANRSTYQSMDPQQKIDRRYHLFVGPWYHGAGAGLDLNRILLEWYDTWLKGKDTEFDDSRGTVHLHELGADRWVENDRWPLPGTVAEPWYLAAGPSDSGSLSTTDGQLLPTPPTDASGEDTVVWTGAGNPCERQTMIQGAGIGGGYSRGALETEPCEDDERLLGAGPGAATYTTPPFTTDRTLAGPITASLAVASSTEDAYLVVSVQDVAPDGTATPLTAGALLARFRANDASRTWTLNGRSIRPYHPFSKESVQFLVPGVPAQLDIEVFPTFARIAKDHRIRITVTTADSPHVTPAGYQLPELVGGVYRIQRNATHSSHVNLPFIDPAAAGTDCGVCRTPPPAAAG
jgi:hypothetical protein